MVKSDLRVGDDGDDASMRTDVLPTVYENGTGTGQHEEGDAQRAEGQRRHTPTKTHNLDTETGAVTDTVDGWAISC